MRPSSTQLTPSAAARFLLILSVGLCLIPSSICRRSRPVSLRVQPLFVSSSPTRRCHRTLRSSERPRPCRRRGSTGYHDDDDDDDTYAPSAGRIIPPRSRVANDDVELDGAGIRLNKVFKATHSRREADALIEAGRVAVNGETVRTKGGYKVVPYVDVVSLDGVPVTGWEEMNGFVVAASAAVFNGQATDNVTGGGARSKRDRPGRRREAGQRGGSTATPFEYVKYWKPRGVTCTTDRSVRGNIIEEIGRDGYRPRHRVYPVGRLDKDTSGLIVLTSDGRLPNSALRGQFKQPKTYEVFVDRPLRASDIQRLRNGVVITTVAQRDGNRAKPLTAKTLPCEVEQIDQYGLWITLYEGRNRQIRKMLDALDYRVTRLHRVEFMGLSLRPLRGPGDWMELDENEMVLVEKVLRNAEIQST